MAEQRQPERLACLIAGRNLGDIVVWSNFFKKLVARNYAQQYLVWTRPQLAFLFEDTPNCTVVCSQFPVGTTKQFDGAAALRFLKAALTIRRRRPSITLDLVGDVRERWFARIVGSPRHIHVGWAPNHPHARLIRNPFGSGRAYITVPANVPNVYDAYGRMLDLLAPRENEADTFRREPSAISASNRPLRVGLHPFASQACKLWPSDNWRQLSRELLLQGAELIAFGAPTEQSALQLIFAEFGSRVALVAGSIAEFARAVAELDILVGLDSFSVHMAHRQGIRSITINAGTPSQLWAVPSGQTLAGSGGCTYYPCYNIPQCEGTVYEHVCVKSVTPGQVFVAINNLLSSSQSKGTEQCEDTE
jgi:heptosyltransferase-3